MKAGPLISDKIPGDSLPGNSLETSADSVPVIPNITLRQPPLSRGPISTVYTGWDKAHRCSVIVKVQRATEDAVTLSRFGREAAVMLRLRHPSIVSLYAFHPGDPAKNDPAALVMEYVSGETLAALVAQTGFLPPPRAVQIVEEIAAALDCVHGIGIVHRDVKPSNILVPPQKLGPAKLTDFGVARIDDDVPLTVMGDILGTIEYASPEQVHGKDTVDARSDVYSLAAVAYFALTGTPPFRAADSSTQAQLSVMHRQVFAEPPPLRLHRADLPEAVEAAVLRGLAKAPDARYASAGQLAAALRAAVTPLGASQQAATVASARLSGLGAGVIAAVVFFAGLGIWMAHPLQVLPPGPLPSDPPIARTKSVVPRIVPPTKPVPIATHTSSSKPALRIAPVPARELKVIAVKSTVRQPTAKKQIAVIAPPLYAPTRLRPAVHAVRLAQRPASSPPRKLQARAVPITPPLRVAQKPRSAVPIAAAAASSVIAGVGWYTVSGWIALPSQAPAQKAALVQAPPLWIKVDGQPSPVLAGGQWAELRAGTHSVTYQPPAGYGVGPKTWTITLAPAAHLSQQIPLPPAPLPLIPVHLRNP